MLPIGMLLGLGSYGLTTWGYILVKGYNITLRQWFSPLHPYQGGLSAAGTVPKGSIFPTSGKGSQAAPGSSATTPHLPSGPNPHGIVQ